MRTSTILSIGEVLMTGMVIVITLSPIGNNSTIPTCEEELGVPSAVEITTWINRHCFEFEEDYQAFKENILNEYEANLPLNEEGGIGYFETDIDFADYLGMLNEEIDRGNVNVDELMMPNDLQNEMLRLKNEMNLLN